MSNILRRLSEKAVSKDARPKGRIPWVCTTALRPSRRPCGPPQDVGGGFCKGLPQGEVKELDSILFYPVQYEGEESERNVFYTGAAPNQQAIPAVDYLMSEDGGSVKRWVLEGTDYVYPRTTNKILEAYLLSKGVAAEDIMVNYTPFGFSDWQTEVSAKIKKFGSAGKKTAVVSTVNGDANVPFYKELGNQGIKATDIPVVAFSVGEEELAGIDTKPLVGHLAAWNYFQSIDTPENAGVHQEVARLHGNDKRTTNDPMEATVIGFNAWVKAVEKAGTTDSGQRHRRDDRCLGAEPDRRLLDHHAEPPHHQAGLYRRDPGRRPA
jgi:ABC-type branched-subunit amino acid transport system substrate-binding protein